MSLSLEWSNVMAWRLARQGLAAREPGGRMLEVVSRICGLHAQLLSSAELSLWARVDGVTSQTVPDALWNARTLVKTWAMRGTLHLLPASEYWTWQAALSTYDHYLKPSWFKYLELSKEQQKVRFTLPEWWLGARADADPAACVSEVTRRFLGSNGPAARDDYTRWWGISPAQALAGSASSVKR